MSLMKKLFGDYSSRELKSIYPIVDKIDALADEYKAMSDAQLKAKTQEFKDRLANGETLDDILPEAFATVREAAGRVLGMRHYRVQLVGGVVLHQVKYPSVQEVIATAKVAGAVLVFAHPTVYKSMPLVRQLAKEGIIDGIEVEHPRNSPEDRAECAALCEQYGLIHTGGTDFHGANHKVPHPVGTCTTADDQVARILELAHKRRGIDV